MLTPNDLDVNQRAAYRDIVKRKRMCISSDCGFGKTVVGLSAFRLIQKKKRNAKMLVVCTPAGVKSTWKGEHLKWSHLKDLKVLPLLGTPKKRLKLLEQQEADVYAVSYGLLKWLHEVSDIKFDFIYADEGDCLKGSSSAWRRWLLKVAGDAPYRVISSATPKTREEDDYWGLCKFLDNGESLGAPTVGAFRAKYCSSYTVNKGVVVWTINKVMIPELERRIKHLFINYGESVESTIPIKTITIKGKLSETSQELYDKLQTEQCVNSLVYNHNGYIDNDESLSPTALSTKLNQLSSGFVYVDDSLRIRLKDLEGSTDTIKLLNESKKRKVVDIFDDRTRMFKQLIGRIERRHPDTPIAIAYHFKHELTQLQRILPEGVSDTHPTFKDDWNAKKIKYLFMQYSRSSKSLNLQDGGNVMAMYSPTFKWVDDYQIVRRLARQGQRASYVYVYRLYLEGTVDDVKTRRLDERFQGHRRFQTEILNNVNTHHH